MLLNSKKIKLDADGWEIRTLGQLGQIFTGRTPPTKEDRYFGLEMPFICPGDMHQGRYINMTDRGLSSDGADLLCRIIVPENSICVGCIGWQMGEVAMTARPSVTNQQINTIVTDPCVADPYFVYYSLKQHKQELLSLGSSLGSRTPILKKSAFSKLTIMLPSLAVQKKLAKILSVYDDLIENNRRRIELLERSARLLYKEWFVHLRFPGHEHVAIGSDGIPEGWEKKNLFDIADAVYGYAFKSSLFNDSQEGLPVVRIRDVPNGISNTFSPEEAPEEKILENGDFLIGMDGDFHMNFWYGGKAWLNQRVVKIQAKKDYSTAFIRYTIEKQIQDFNKTIVGTTVSHLGAKHLKEISILIASSTISDSINENLESIWHQLIKLNLQNQKLQQARDLLLPRLMNGEITV